MNMEELNSESYNQKILLKKSPKMDLIFDPSPGPHKTVRNPKDHRHIGMTTYYGINLKKFKKCKNILGYALNKNPSFCSRPNSLIGGKQRRQRLGSYVYFVYSS